MDSLISEVLGQVRGIAQDVLRREGVRLRTATVTSTSPLRIRYDGESDASVVPPRRAALVATGDRVVVAKTRGQATVLGVLGGGQWTPLEVLPGYEAQVSPECRIENGRVHLRGGIAGTGLATGKAYSCMRIPAEFRPTRWAYGNVAASTAEATAMSVVQSDGIVELHTSASLGGYYLWDQFSYPL